MEATEHDIHAGGISRGGSSRKCVITDRAVSEGAMLGDGYANNNIIKKEVAAGPECVRADLTCLNRTGSETTSKEALLDGLYTNHVIKDELVLGPESIQRPNIYYGWTPGDAVTCSADVATSTRDQTDSAPSNGQYDAAHKINTHTGLLRDDTEELSEKRDIQAMNSHCCQICRKLFTRPSDLKRHMQVHDEKDFIMKPHHCQICHRYFTRSSDLKRHMQVHSGAKPVCQLCDKEFSRITELKIHERLHTREKLYSCDICKKEFPEMRRLKSHRLIHSSKLHSCDICKKEFRHTLTLKLHKNTHTGEKSYTCDVCKKEFTRLSTLNTHKRIHTGETPYCCELCNVSFAGLRELKIHKLFSHADSTETWDL